MRERRVPVVALAAWGSILIAGSFAATLRGVDIARLTYNGVVLDGVDQAAMDAFRDLILWGEGLRMLTPGLVISACLTLIAMVGVLAVRWERRRVATQPDQGTIAP